MHDHDTPEVNRDLLEQLGYEHQDVEVDARLSWGAVILFASVFVSIAIAWAVIGLVDRTQTITPSNADMVRNVTPPADAPLLQSDVTAKKDIKVMRAEEAKRMAALKWNEKEPGFATIPVETAMDVVVKRGLPTRPNAKNPEERK